MTSTRIRITRTEFFFSVHVILRSVLDNFNNWLIAGFSVNFFLYRKMLMPLPLMTMRLFLFAMINLEKEV